MRIAQNSRLKAHSLLIFSSPHTSPTLSMNSGSTAFVLLSSGLVAIMTPGLAFFYGGLVKRNNVLTVMMQSMIAMGIVSVLWSLLTFSLAFGSDVNGIIGSLEFAFMHGVGLTPSTVYGPEVPFLAFFVFQMMFAVITPALITGAFVDRMNFKAYLVFLILWSIVVYAVLAHWVWGGGFIAKLGAIDFAGGTVVHISAGMAALASVFVFGKRQQTSVRPHNIPFVALGTALLWFGWYGFNAGSALAANGQAAAAFVNTQVAPAAAMIAWLFLAWIVDGKPSVVGPLVGAVVGLVAVTPAAGYVEPIGAMIIGVFAAVACFFAMKFRAAMKWDDALDVWGCHGIGGIVGSILTGVFAAKEVGGFSGLLEGNPAQFISNLEGTAISVVYAFVATYVLLLIMKACMKITVDPHDQQMIDKVLHGEEAYE